MDKSWWYSRPGLQKDIPIPNTARHYCAECSMGIPNLRLPGVYKLQNWPQGLLTTRWFCSLKCLDTWVWNREESREFR